MKKKITTILSMVLVVGLIAAIPASTQILSGSSSTAGGERDLPMLILVNRLELSEEQMNALNDILSDLVDEKDEMSGLRAEFEEAMIEFNGTEEELDAMLVTFREEQQALAEALGESVEVSLDKVRDLLSINQGIVLREQLPQLLGLDATQRVGVSNGQLRKAPDMMSNRMASSSMGRAGMTGQNNVNEDMETMIEQRLGQDVDDETIEAIREQMQGRFEQMRDRVPEELMERFGERASGVREGLDGRLGQTTDAMAMGQMGGRANNVMAMSRQGGIDQRDVNSIPMRHMQTSRGQLGEHGNLFEFLERITDVLDLKLEATE